MSGFSPWRLGSVAAATLILLPARREAQTMDLEEDCLPTRVATLTNAEIGPAWRPFHPESVKAEIAPALKRLDYRDAMRTVIGNARLMLKRVDDTTLAAKYGSRLDELEMQFDRLLRTSSESTARYLADIVRPADFQLAQNPNTGNIAFGAAPLSFTMTEHMSVNTRRGVCWSAITIHHVVTKFGEPERARSAEALAKLAERWENFVDNRYSQLPWELALNSYRYGQQNEAKRSYEPPSAQWILLHPSAGAQMSGPTFREVRRSTVATIEGFGIIRYNDRWTRYVGASIMAAFAPDANATAGPYFHLWYPQAKLGVMFGASGEHPWRPGYLVSVDLYDFFAGIPDQLNAARDRALGQITRP